MSDAPHSRPELVSAIKEYIAPLLLTLVGLFIWRDISEMRSDVKLLLVQQSADKVRIEKMESDVTMLKATVYSNRVNEKTKTDLSINQPAKKEEEQEIH